MSRSHHRAARLLGALVVGAGLLVPGSGPPAGAQPSRTVQDDDRPDSRGPGTVAADRPTIRLVQQDAVVDPDGDFTVYLEVDGAPEGSDLAVDIYPLIDDEERLDEALAGEPRNSAATFPVIPLPAAVGADPVQTAFVINLWSPGQPSEPGGWAKRLDAAGAYPVRVRLRGPDRGTLETFVTFLVRGPDEDDDVDAAPVALVPVVSSGIPADEALAEPDAPLDPERLNAISALADTFAAHPDVPASFVVPADVARRLRTGAEAGTEPGPDDEGDQGEGDGAGGDGGGESDGIAPSSSSTTGPEGTAPGTDDPSVLAQLREVLAGEHRELLVSAYVDVDPTELVRRDLVDELTRQHQLGFRDLADLIEPPAGDTWFVRRPLDTDTVDALAGIGVTDLLVPPGSLVGDGPARPTRLSGANERSRATVLDPALTTGDGDDPLRDAQALFAHLVARTAIDDGAPQLVDVTLPDSVGDVAQLDALLVILGSDDTFLEATSVTDLLRTTQTAPARATLTAPDLAPSGSYPDDLRHARRLTAAYASMIPDRPDLVAQATEPLSRSAAAGLSAEDRTAHVHEIRDEVEARFDEVSIPSSDRVTLGARDAQFPVVVSSGADVPLRVIVELESASDRLTVKEDRLEVLLDSDRTVVPVRVHSRSPGDTPIRITVSTLDGQVILSEGTYSVRSTAVSGVGLLLTVGAGLFLALWWGRHFLRARRSRARHAR